MRAAAIVEIEIPPILWLGADRPPLSPCDPYQRSVHKNAVFVAAAKIGGILANASFPAQFLYEKLAMRPTSSMGAWRTGVETLLFLSPEQLTRAGPSSTVASR
jgi:GDP-L-fucose synthase